MHPPRKTPEKHLPNRHRLYQTSANMLQTSCGFTFPLLITGCIKRQRNLVTPCTACHQSQQETRVQFHRPLYWRVAALFAPDTTRHLNFSRSLLLIFPEENSDLGFIFLSDFSAPNKDANFNIVASTCTHPLLYSRSTLAMKPTPPRSVFGHTPMQRVRACPLPV
jgi:hypothetical protein